MIRRKYFSFIDVSDIITLSGQGYQLHFPWCTEVFFKFIYSPPQLFFEDNIDDAKYCGRLYGLGSGSSQPQNGISSSGQEETNNKHWPSSARLVLKLNQQISPLTSISFQSLNKTQGFFPFSLLSDCGMDSATVDHSFLLRGFYWVYGHIFRTLF